MSQTSQSRARDPARQAIPTSSESLPHNATLASAQDAKTTKNSWRDILPVHPAADLFPLMSPDELRVLGEDIRKHGIKNSIVVWSPDPDSSKEYLLDGRNRLDAMEAAGLPIIDHKRRVSVRTIHLYGAGEARSFIDGSSLVADPYSFVISANVHRRHLSVEDKDRLIVKVLQADPTKSNRQVAKMVKASHPHVAKVREQAEKTGDVETVTTSIDSKGRKQAAKRKPTPTEANLEASEAERRGIATRSPTPGCDDIGAVSTGEAARLQARVEQLQAELRQRDIKIVGLESEIDEVKIAAQKAVEQSLVRQIAEMIDLHGSLMEDFISEALTFYAEDVAADQTDDDEASIDWRECADTVLDMLGRLVEDEPPKSAAPAEEPAADDPDLFDIPPELRRTAPAKAAS